MVNPSVKRDCEIGVASPGSRYHFTSESVASLQRTILASGLLCIVLPAYAQYTGVAALAFTPFSVGLLGGLITGAVAPGNRWHRYGSLGWFVGWVLLYATVFAIFSEHSIDAIPTALGVSVFWGVVPFAIAFTLGRFVTAKLRAYIVSRDQN
jgi:hypothetical protein